MEPETDSEPIPQPEPLTRAEKLLIVLKAFIIAILLSGATWAIIQRNYLEAVLIVALSCISLSPYFIGRRYAITLPAEFELVAIIFLYASLFLGEMGDFYNRFAWWDTILHTGSGFLLGVVAFVLVFTLNQRPDVHLTLDPFFLCLFAFCFAVAAGAIWEIFEYAMDRTFGLNMQKSGLVDTMWDLIVDTIGALVVSIMGYAYLKHGRESFINDWIRNFARKNPHLFKRKGKKQEEL